MRRGLPKTELARLIGVSPSTIATWEANKPPADDEIVKALADTLDFPREFLLSEEIEIPDLGATHFRAGKRATKRQKNAAIAAGTSARLLADWLRTNFDYPVPELPDLTGWNPREAAQQIRYEWALGDHPLPNSIQLAESRGIGVFGLPPAAVPVDAFSLWDGPRPFIFLARRRTPEGTRFDLAHELGHLLLHSKIEHAGDRDVEQEADEFASEFLIPTIALHMHVPPHSSLDTLMAFKRHYKVSAMSALVAAHFAGKFNDPEYRSIVSRLSAAGYRTSEPNSVLQYERSRIFDYVLGVDGGKTIGDIASATHLPVEDIAFLMLTSAATSITGEGKQSAESAAKRASLRIVR